MDGEYNIVYIYILHDESRRAKTRLMEISRANDKGVAAVARKTHWRSDGFVFSAKQFTELKMIRRQRDVHAGAKKTEHRHAQTSTIQVPTYILYYTVILDCNITSRYNRPSPRVFGSSRKPKKF